MRGTWHGEFIVRAPSCLAYCGDEGREKTLRAGRKRIRNAKREHLASNANHCRVFLRGSCAPEKQEREVERDSDQAGGGQA